MSLLFADIYDGIRCLRVKKGACEKDILNYVQEKVGGTMKVSNVLKTIKTLKKLVDDGVLCKKGQRYTLAPKPEKNEEEEEEEEPEPEDNEEEEEDDEGDDDEGDECDKQGESEEDDEEEEEEEEEEDEDEEEEEEDEDEDDDECNEDNLTKPDEDDQNKQGEKSGENSMPPSSQCGNGNEDAEEGKDGANNPCMQKEENDSFQKGAPKKNICKQNNDANCMKDTLNPDKVKESESIAFCVRDFIDSLGNTKSDDHQKFEVEDDADDKLYARKIPELSRVFASKKQAFRAKKRTEARRKTRSRSPIDSNFYGLMKDYSENLNFQEMGSELFQDPIDVDVAIDQDNEGERNDLQKIRVESTVLVNPNAGRQGSRSDLPQLRDETDLKMKTSFEGLNEKLGLEASQVKVLQLKKSDCGNMNWYALEESDKRQEMLKRSHSSSSEDRNFSLCSVCEKKKRHD